VLGKRSILHHDDESVARHITGPMRLQALWHMYTVAWTGLHCFDCLDEKLRFMVGFATDAVTTLKWLHYLCTPSSTTMAALNKRCDYKSPSIGLTHQAQQVRQQKQSAALCRQSARHKWHGSEVCIQYVEGSRHSRKDLLRGPVSFDHSTSSR